MHAPAPRIASRLAALVLACGALLVPRAPAFGAEPDPAALFADANRLLFAGKPRESAALFDRLVETEPAAEPDLWQRGIALYYADRFDDGRLQFERHRTVNPDDVENAAWHYACAARASGREAARQGLLPVGEDRRIPMREILALYAGRGEPQQVLDAAAEGDEPQRRNQLCYAHLYLGLYHEARGEPAAAERHLLLAAGPYAMEHYMGRVARLHVQLRGWDQAAEQSAEAPEPAADPSP
jgi:lipoprotein NlpI